ncbi:MAG: hypothetical protein NZM10_00640, partial [Fimbriimonadales bacterium]|nr:hypothetical protein [Fimbriimonadales bacterium]
ACIDRQRDGIHGGRLYLAPMASPVANSNKCRYSKCSRRGNISPSRAFLVWSGGLGGGAPPPTKEARGLGVSLKQSVAWTVCPSTGHGHNCPCYLHGLKARATQGRQRDADATKTRSHP